MSLLQVAPCWPLKKVNGTSTLAQCCHACELRHAPKSIAFLIIFQPWSWIRSVINYKYLQGCADVTVNANSDQRNNHNHNITQLIHCNRFNLIKKKNSSVQMIYASHQTFNQSPWNQCWLSAASYSHSLLLCPPIHPPKPPPCLQGF